MWPLSVAVNGGRWCNIKCGARPGIVVSLELWARARRSDGVGGEHKAWCIKWSWLPAMKVAETLVAMAVMGNSMVGGLLVDYWFVGVSSTIQCACICCRTELWALMCNGTSNFCEKDLALCIAECHHTNKGVRRQAWDDVGKVCHSREVRQIQHTGVRGLHLVSIGQAFKDGFVGKLYVGDGGTGGEEVACCAGV
jgi:hypothetical protein